MVMPLHSLLSYSPKRVPWTLQLISPYYAGSLSIAAGPIIYPTRLGGTVTLRCDTEGVPPPRVTWSRDGELVFRGFEEDNSLRIYAVTYDDAGEYVCTADNDKNMEQRRVTVVIQGMLPARHTLPARLSHATHTRGTRYTV